MAEQDNLTHEVIRYYLQDLGLLLKEQALKAKVEKDAQMEDLDRAYHLGYLMALHEVISLMQQQADSFGIPRDMIRLEDIEPERDLL